jgi:mannose-6-phosphate isomerase-like protein (cupin superfamily)
MHVTTEPIDLNAEFAKVEDLWSPRVVGRANDHDDEDEMFLVLHGTLEIRFEDRPTVTVGAGQFVIVPRGVRHLPVAHEPADVVLIEPATTRHTGNEVIAGRARSIEQQING